MRVRRAASCSPPATGKSSDLGGASAAVHVTCIRYRTVVVSAVTPSFDDRSGQQTRRASFRWCRLAFPTHSAPINSPQQPSALAVAPAPAGAPFSEAHASLLALALGPKHLAKALQMVDQGGAVRCFVAERSGRRAFLVRVLESIHSSMSERLPESVVSIEYQFHSLRT